jgi:hypothetical protein
MSFTKHNLFCENSFALQEEFYFEGPMAGLTVCATCSSFAAITGGKVPTSGQCPLDSAPTARPRMFYKIDH